MTDDVIWTLPGSSLVSEVAHGVTGILQRAQAIVDRNVTLEIMHVVLWGATESRCFCTTRESGKERCLTST